jgi:hypothetical protein
MDEKYRLDKIAIEMAYASKDNELFMSTDTEDLFKKNLASMPDDWVYRTKQIKYNLNSLGYRTKELDDIDQNNFFITYGCSFTFGVGLAEDELWTTTLSNELGIECLNLAMGGAGMDLIYLNTMTYLKNTDIRPKFVVIQCPDPSRMIMRSLDKFKLAGAGFPGDNATLAMYMQAIRDNSYLHTSYLAWHATMTFWKTAGVPVYFWAQNNNWGDLITGFELDYYWPTHEEHLVKNRARDLAHFSAIYQIRTGKEIAQKLRNDPKFGIGTVDNL